MISVEGARTERQYFAHLRQFTDCIIELESPRGSEGSGLRKVLQRIEDSMSSSNRFERIDEAWIVVDRNSWPEGDLDQLHKWTSKDPKYGLAVSNPNFEYWLLLHFEDGNKILSKENCLSRLRRHVPNYDKKVEKGKFPKGNIEKAVVRARARHRSKGAGWPRSLGETPVYRLVERILDN